MKFLDDIPEKEMFEHDEAGTLGDSDEITLKDLEKFDKQIEPFSLEVVAFENGSALEWFVQKK